MNKLRKKFTKWYYKKRYTFGYLCTKAFWKCPFYIRPLLIFFSPSQYFICTAEEYVGHFKQGLTEGQEWVDKTGTILEQLQNMEEDGTEEQ